MGASAKPASLYRELRSGRTARFDGKLVHLLTRSAQVFAQQGFEKASIRHVAKAAGLSLAGPYHYVSGKEELLFFIQYHTFGALAEELEKILAEPAPPEAHLRSMIESHVRYLVDHLPELKVCTTELSSLRGEHYRLVLGRRQRYFELACSILSGLRDRDRGARLEPALAALHLFGMLNWIVMWFDPKRNEPAELSAGLTDLFLHGFRKGAAAGSARTSKKNGKGER